MVQHFSSVFDIFVINENFLISGIFKQPEKGDLYFSELVTDSCVKLRNFESVEFICTSHGYNLTKCVDTTGGPLFVFSEGGPFLIGIAHNIPTDGCIASNPIVFSRVESHIDFIESKTGKLNEHNATSNIQNQTLK